MQSNSQTNPIRILIAEDFHGETEALLRELRDGELNFEPLIVKSEKAFCDEIEASKVDVVLSPFSLKGTNAAKLLRIARTSGSDVPFILLAFDLSEDIAIDLLSQGFEDYVQSSTLKRLPTAVKKALQRHKTQLELRISEARLKASEESLRNMVRKAPIAMAMFDTEMRYLVVSEKWLQHEKKSERNIIGKNHYEVVPEIPESWKRVHLDCLNGATHGSDREKMIRADGSVETLRWKMNPWYNAEGAIGGAVLFIEDITGSIETQVELEKSEASLKRAQQIAKVGSWEWKPGSDKVWMSDEMFSIYEIEKRDVRIDDIRALIHPEDRKRVEETVKADLTEHIVPVIDYRVVTPSGNVKYVVSSAQQIFDKSGKVVQLVGTLQDITERKAIENELHEKEQLLSEMAESITEVFWLTDWVNNQVLYVSPRYEMLYGLPAQDLYDNPASWTKIIHPEDAEFVKKKFQQEAALGTYDVEYRLLMENGEIKWIRDRAFPIRNEKGDVVRMAGLTEEITEQKQNQDRLATLSLVARETVNGVVIQDGEGKAIWANNGFEQITGYPPDEVLGKEPWSLVGGPDTNLKLVEITYQQMAEGKPFSSVNQLLRKDGKVLWVNTSFTPIIDENGKVKNIVSIGTDISKQKELEELQRNLLKEMELRVQERTSELERINEKLKTSGNS
jgi:PAS domain S-box-containing protein